MKYLYAAILTVIMAFPATALDIDASLGVGVFAERSPYNDESYNINVLPLIKINYKRFFIDILTAGFYLYEGDNASLAVIADYQSLALKPRKTDNELMSKLNRRNPTVLAGLDGMAWSRFGIVKAHLLSDILGNSNGLRARLSYMLLFDIAEKIYILPEAGTYWHSRNHNNYYYGVSEGESMATGYGIYRPSSGFMPFAAVSVLANVHEHISVSLKAEYIYFTNPLTDSPITDKNYGAALFAGISYVF